MRGLLNNHVENPKKRNRGEVDYQPPGGGSGGAPTEVNVIINANVIANNAIFKTITFDGLFKIDFTWNMFLPHPEVKHSNLKELPPVLLSLFYEK